MLLYFEDCECFKQSMGVDDRFDSRISAIP